MATKSSNTQGNPYHDEEGKFTSANDSGEKFQKIESKIKLKDNVDLGGFKKPSLKMKGGMNLQDLVDRLNDLNQVAEIPHLRSARDIENNIEQFFSKQVSDKLNEMYGMTAGCASYQFHPKANSNVSLNLFTCVLGKYRYKDNHAHLVNKDEFDKILSINDFNILMNKFSGYGYSSRVDLAQVNDFQPVFRGITSYGQKRQDILNSYGTMDLNNYDIYGNGMYGTNIYTTVNINYAKSYGTPIQGILDGRNAFYMNERQIRSIQSNINDSGMQDKIKNKLLQNGLSENRSTRIANSFVKSMHSDMSLVAILLGLDFQICDNHQRNILNLNRWYIRNER